jgi:hypothetical protein
MTTTTTKKSASRDQQRDKDEPRKRRLVVCFNWKAEIRKAKRGYQQEETARRLEGEGEMNE